MNIFNSIKLTKPASNRFDLSHDVKMSFDIGALTPTCVIECVPGDRFHIGCESLLRFAPLVAPVMHRLDVYMHYFFVPNRLLWPNWEKYITNTPLTPGGVLPAFPTVYHGPQTWGRLSDYLGLPEVPVGALYGHQVSALPFAAYQRIYHEYYRDQNLIEQEPITLIDGNNGGAAMGPLFTMQQRAWEHDYFTSCLPWAQKGNAVTLPIAGFKDVPVKVNTSPAQAGQTTSWATTKSTPGGSLNTFVPLEPGTVGSTGIGSDALYADTSAINSGTTTINDLRRAYKLQEWLEKAARGGSRYVENILHQFGVKSSDARLNRPEYITGTKSPVIISEVLNTTGTASLPQGNMAGHAISVTQNGGKGYFCEEHGYIMGIMSVLPKTAYYQGIPKHFVKTTDPFEFYWPSFANIGEQEVKVKELYAWSAGQAAGEQIFGYIPRYGEYKYMQSRVAGDFRNTLDFWHLGRKFANTPALNRAFVECTKTAADRMFAVVGTTQNLYAHVLHKIHATRRMPKFGTPSF